MLVLSRKQNEEIFIGDNVCIKVVGVFGNKVRLGISAPEHVAIRRGEIAFLGSEHSDPPQGTVFEDIPLKTIKFSISPRAEHLLEHV